MSKITKAIWEYVLASLVLLAVILGIILAFTGCANPSVPQSRVVKTTVYGLRVEPYPSGPGFSLGLARALYVANPALTNSSTSVELTTDAALRLGSNVVSEAVRVKGGPR